MTDPIAKVQAMVGCVHEWDGPAWTNGRRNAGLLGPKGWEWFCYACHGYEVRDTSKNMYLPPRQPNLPTSAPDCSTLDGAVKVYLDGDRWSALELGNTIVTAYTKKGNERAMATAVCELTLKGVEGGK